MTGERILQNEIASLGQSQDDRTPAALDPAYAPIDARNPADRVQELQRLAAKLRFYADDPSQASGDWQPYLPPETSGLITARDGQTPAHLGLMAAFFDMLAPAQQAMNQIGERHLDFHYQQVLGFTADPPQPEHAHLCLTAKKGVEPFAIEAGSLFLGGKDAQGRERHYTAVRTSIIGQGQVTHLHSVYRNGNGLHFAPIANSADGLGEPLPPQSPSWQAFGHTALPAAPVGFAFASSLLRMSEGRRQIRLGMALSYLSDNGLNAERLGSSVDAYLTGEKGWLGPYAVSGLETDGLVELVLSVPAGDPAVVDCSATVHGNNLSTSLPVVKLVLRANAADQFGALSAVRLDQVQLIVSVEGKKDLSLENDFGSLNPKKAFQPFGPQPVTGGRFMIGCPEALSKPLSSLSIQLSWQGAPGDLSSWYAYYSRRHQIANGVQARLVYEDSSGVQTVREQDLMARVNGITTLSPTAPSVPTTSNRPQELSYLLIKSGHFFSKLFGQKLFLSQAIAFGQEPPPPTPLRPGFITVALVEDFLHADYRKETLAHARKQDNTVLNEPYTPTVQEISLQYSAKHPLISLSDTGETAFTSSADLQFFHVGAFGARREHAFLREPLTWVPDKQPGLLPAYPDEGEWMIGVNGVSAGQSIDLLIQVAEGSANPDLTAQAVSWSVLCGNYWRPLSAEELVLDTTHDLRTSGIVGMTLSRLTTTEHGWLPAGSVWLKASIHRGSTAACLVQGVTTNALEVVRQWPPDMQPAIETLAPDSINKMLPPPAGLKKITQPYASFGGRAAESTQQLRRRAAERLRHRQRCITPWDYERLLLHTFPSVHRIKCIPHANAQTWMAPGHVLIVAVPDLKQQQRTDMLTPKVDLDTLTSMQALAQAQAAPGVTVHVRNPRYQAVRLDFGVRFRPGHPFDYTRQQLHTAIVQALSPWAFDSERPLHFGGRIYRSVLLDMIEELAYVDYVTHFRCGLAGEGLLLLNDVSELVADQPDVILVSAAQHVIHEASD